MPVSTGDDEIGSFALGYAPQLIRSRTFGMQHRLDVRLYAMPKQIVGDVIEMMVSRRFQNLFGDFDQRDVARAFQLR